eukprot:9146714-Ditylum_brightwellii.AAC.1
MHRNFVSSSTVPVSVVTSIAEIVTNPSTDSSLPEGNDYDETSTSSVQLALKGQSGMAIHSQQMKALSSSSLPPPPPQLDPQ